MARKQQPEFELQKAVCRYLDAQFSSCLYLSDTIANLYLTIPQRVRNKAIQKTGFHCPDLLILEPRNGYHGLFIELKVVSPFKKNGELRKDEHLQGQMKSITDLQRRGYYACFSTGFDQTKRIIDEYFGGRISQPDHRFQEQLN